MRRNLNVYNAICAISLCLPKQFALKSNADFGFFQFWNRFVHFNIQRLVLLFVFIFYFISIYGCAIKCVQLLNCFTRWTHDSFNNSHVRRKNRLIWHSLDLFLSIKVLIVSLREQLSHHALQKPENNSSIIFQNIAAKIWEFFFLVITETRE